MNVMTGSLLSDEGTARRRLSALQALLVCLAIAACFWSYWSLFPNLTAGSVGNDALFLLDGARRIAAGQVPHLDFSLPTGVLPYLTYLLGQHLFLHFSAYVSSHLLGFLLLCPILIAGMVQMPRAMMALALAVIVSIATLLPFNTSLSDTYGVVFHASYNRLSTALSLVYFAWLFRAERSSPWINGVIIAYALLLAFFLKIVLLGVILGPLAVLAILDRRWRLPALFGVISASLALLVLELAGGYISAYIADIGAMSRVNAGAAPYFFASFIFRTFVLQILVVTLVLWLLYVRWQGSAPRDRLANIAQPLAMLAAIGALSFAESQSTGGLEFAGALGLLFAPGLIGRSLKGSRLAIMAATAGLIAGPLVISAFENSMALLLDRQGKPVPAAWVSRYLPQTLVPEPMLHKAAGIASLWERDDRTRNILQEAATDIIDRSALDLYLAQWLTVDHAMEKMSGEELGDLGAVATLANVDLFGLALRAEPTKGIKIVHDVGRTIQPLDAEQASAYIAAAETVFEPTCLIDEAPGSEPMAAWFADVLKTEFSAKVLTPCWTMHRRNSQMG